MNDESTQDIALTPPELVAEARARLSSALHLLGGFPETLLRTSSLQGASILARDAGRLLHEVIRVRSEQ